MKTPHCLCGHARRLTSATNQHLALCGFQPGASQCLFIYSLAQLLARGATRVGPSHLPRLFSHENCWPLSARLQRPGWWWIPHTAFSPSHLHKVPLCPRHLLGSVFPRMRHTPPTPPRIPSKECRLRPRSATCKTARRALVKCEPQQRVGPRAEKQTGPPMCVLETESGHQKSDLAQRFC